MEKKVRTAPTNTSLLPPCKVCLEPAAGFHYGVNTCEACKGFFRRSLLRDKPYKCLGNGNCNIRAGKRHICPKCRHIKCLAVGMSKEAIKTGRYTHAKRTQDILEYQEMMGKCFDSYLSTATVTSTTTCSSENSSMTVSSDHYQCLSQSECGDFSNTLPQSLSNDSLKSLSQTLSSGSLKFLSTEDSSCSTLHDTLVSTVESAAIPQNQAAVDLEASVLDRPFELTAVDSPPVVPVDMLGNLEKVEEAVSPSSSAFCSSQSSDKSRSPRSVIGSPQHSYISSPLSVMASPQSVDKSSPWSVMSSSQCTDTSGYDSAPGAEMSLTPIESGEGDLDNEECAKIVDHLLQSHENITVMAGDRMTDLELLEKQKACFDACRARADLFGCKGLSRQEYLDFYNKTGMDIDNRQWLMGQHLCPIMDQAIRKYIAFAKTIPGFSELSLNDQINLIKNNRCEFRMLCTFRFYNFELKVMTLESGRAECVHEMAKIMEMEHVLSRFDCAHAISKLNLSADELILLKSLVVVTVGAEDVEDPVKVSTIQWKIAQCLLWLLKQKHTDADKTFAHVISKMCYIREWSVGFYAWLKSNPLEHFGSIQHNPLLSEWFSSI